ncbi:MAG: hydrogenase 3 maturation endopeptidase HyCI [Elusimicrobia bacterium HGW-Elusimicrobia-3]|jgi:hydrogenase 3 maturation protease|nr:MAG: hydrogenase 3 maturation endopeptidase HyCI [Elusimicrobia bacterium HGW-Elusimicrobia-3]
MSPSWNNEAAAALAPRGRTLVVTLGSTLRADDGVGPYVCSHVKFSRPDLLLLDAGTTPENVAQTAINWKPDKLILVDAAHFKGTAGEVRVIPLEAINQAMPISTHSFPLSVTFSIIKEDTGCELAVVGVQAKSLDYREGLSPEVEKTAIELADYFNRIGNL